jgi:hypothetical protein
MSEADSSYPLVCGFSGSDEDIASREPPDLMAYG